MVLERIGFDRVIGKFFKPVQHLYALLVVVIALVIFRADGIIYALHYVRHMFVFVSGSGSGLFLQQYFQPSFILFAIIGVAGCTPLFVRCHEALQTAIVRGNKPLWHLQHIGTIAAIAILLLTVSSFLVAGSYNPFIYFRF